MMYEMSVHRASVYGNLGEVGKSLCLDLHGWGSCVVSLLAGLILGIYPSLATADSDAEPEAAPAAEYSTAADDPPASAVPDPTADLSVEEILQRDPEASDYGEAPRCLNTRRIRRTQVLDEQHVLIEVGRDEYYLVQFKHRCPMLRRGEPVIYEPTGNRLCEMDALRGVLDQGLGDLRPGPRCNIPAFQSMTEAQVAQLKEALKSNRERARDERKAKKKRERDAQRRARERDAQAQKNKQVSVSSSPAGMPG